MPTVGRGDGAVEEAAVRCRATVVTADRALASRLRAVGVAVLAPRDRARLELQLPRYAAERRRRPPPGRARPKG